MVEQTSLFNDNAEYETFVDKFKHKKTTDDCYTPPLIYDAIRDWACAEYGVDPAQIVRPFYPGGDYEHYPYPPGCVVLDNPPFSIVSKICDFYINNGIKFFLFAPGLTAFSGRNCMRITHVIPDARITYENGAKVPTAFVTNLGDRDIIAQTAPELGKAINRAQEIIARATTVQLPRYSYPDNVITAAKFKYYSNYGVELVIKRQDCAEIGALDAQRANGKTIFGGGLLLSSAAAAEKAAAETVIWELSPRERAIVAQLDKKTPRRED